MAPEKREEKADRLWMQDLAIGAAATIAGTIFLILTDSFDRLHEYSRRHESWDLDEFILGLGVLAASSAWFAWRRKREAEAHLGTNEALKHDLRKSHDELSFLVGAAPGVLYACRADGDFGATFISPSAKAQLGYEPTNFTNDPRFWIDNIHPRDRERVLEGLGSLFEADRHTHEYRFRHADGSYQWMHDQLTLFRDPNGNPERIVGFWHDITERKAFERQLATAVNERTVELNLLNQALQSEIEAREQTGNTLTRREEQSARLIKSLPGFVYVCDYDEDWTMRYVSEGVQTILGYSADDLTGNRKISFAHLIHPDDQDVILASAEKNLAEHKPSEYMYRIRTASGAEIKVWERSHGVYDESGNVVRIEGYIEDITDRKRTEEQLFQAQKMEAVGQLTGGIAHDFNNMLAAVIGNLEVLEDHVKGDASAEKSLDVAFRGASRAAELTAHLLAFSRQQRLEPESMNLRDMLSGMSGILRTSVTPAVDLSVEVAEHLWCVWADPAQLESAIINLALNAKDAMPNGGRLLIEATNAELDGKYTAKHAGLLTGSYVMLAVSDNGTGISQADQDRVFDPFFTTKEVGKGTGMGLSMLYGYIKQLGGHVTLYSEEGQGTSVKLYLPVSTETEQHSPDAAASKGSYPGGKETVLVVEDDGDVRETALALLEDLGYRVLTAENGSAALTTLDEHPEVDLLFTDIIMPGNMSGIELVRKVSKRAPNLKVLCTSGYTQEALAKDGKLDETVEWISKPYFQKALALKVRQVLDGPRAQMPISEEVSR